MSIKVTRVQLYDNGSGVKAFVDILFSEMITVMNFKLLQGKKGLWVSMPQEPRKEEWFDLAKPYSKEVAEEIKKVVLQAYEAEKSKVGTV